MIRAIPPLTDKHKKLLKFLFIKFPIILVILIFVMIGALKLVERYPAPLREGFEKYLSQQTNTNATIGHVKKVAFYPNIDIQLEDITLHRSNNAAIIDLKVEKFNISAPLSDLFIRKGRINFIDIQNLTANKNILTPFDIELKTVQIIDRADNEDKALFVAEGQYAGKKFNLTADIQKNKKFYRVLGLIPLHISLENYQIKTILQKNLFDVILSSLTFQKDNKVSDIKDFIFIENKTYKTDNPLACLYLNAGEDLQQCDQYLKGNE